MSAELGKIEKPTIEEFKTGRKLYFVPLIYGSKGLPSDYQEILNKYWKQADDQISDLELKLGPINRIYHELITSIEEDGLKGLKNLSEKSFNIMEKRVKKGSRLEATEDVDLLTEFMDWNRCLAIGLQNRRVMEKVYESYTEASKNREEFILNHIDETLEADEIGVLFMGEDYKIKFPVDIEVFYVSPPGLDEIKRWVRDQEIQHSGKAKSEAEKDDAASS